jgi:hypothetical protein
VAILTAKLKLPDGRVFDVTEDKVEPTTNDPGEHPHSGTIFYWTEGNMGCDCNRASYIEQQHGINLNPDEEHHPCGDTIELLSLKVDGEELL